MKRERIGFLHPSISKTIQHTPMTWCTYGARNACSSYSAKTKRDGWTDRRTEARHCNMSRPRAHGEVGDN